MLLVISKILHTVLEEQFLLGLTFIINQRLIIWNIEKFNVQRHIEDLFKPQRLLAVGSMKITSCIWAKCIIHSSSTRPFLDDLDAMITMYKRRSMSKPITSSTITQLRSPNSHPTCSQVQITRVSRRFSRKNRKVIGPN